MSPTRRIDERARLIAVCSVLAAGAALAGCAAGGTDAKPGAPKPVYQGADVQTGSNLPRRNKPSNVVTVDPDAMQGAVRGASRNSGSPP